MMLTLTGLTAAQPRPPTVTRKLVLTALAVVAFGAALLVLGLPGLIPFGLLLAFSADSDEEGSRRSVRLTWRNLGVAAAMVAAFTWFWLWHVDLTESTLVLLGGILMTLRSHSRTPLIGPRPRAPLRSPSGA